MNTNDKEKLICALDEFKVETNNIVQNCSGTSVSVHDLEELARQTYYLLNTFAQILEDNL